MASTNINRSYDRIWDKIGAKNAVVSVIGLGYVGLPLLDAFVNAGCKTLGFDTDAKKVQALNRGESYIAHIDSSRIANWRERNLFEATTDPKRLAEADAILICVPTPLTESRDPDLSYVQATARTLSEVLRAGQLVVLESTTYPGTTRDVVLPILERSGLQTGVDYFLAYSPEREDPGNPDFSADSIPKVIGGYDAQSLGLAKAFYELAVSTTVPVRNLEIAEACKILENTYRGVNIAMVNELKMLFDRIQIDIWDVIEAAKTKPFGFQAFYPGPGLGGHCIPIDPFYLSWLARKHGMSTRFIELAGEVNTLMPDYVVDCVTEALNDMSKPIRGSKISIFGMAYKKDVDDDRESPSYRLLSILGKRGALLSYCDPHIPQLKPGRNHNFFGMKSSEPTPEYLESQDCVLIATNHSAFDYEMIVRHSKLIIDTRNATRHVNQGQEKIKRA